MTVITSRSNKLITNICKLKNKKFRDESGLFFFEGIKLFKEAYNSKIEFHSLFVRDDRSEQLKKELDSIQCPIYTVTDSVYKKLTDDKSPDGIFCVANKNKSHDDINNKVFILSSVRDPGNLGTCIRSARAFGIDTLILHDCTDAYNPKVIRSSMGAFFRQNIIFCDNITKTIDDIISMGYDVLPTALTENSIPFNRLNINHKSAFIIGNEGHGIDESIIHACGDKSIVLPMPGDTESLNASVAASILMWEMSKL